MVKKHLYNVSLPRLVYFLQSFLLCRFNIEEKIFNKRRGFSGKKSHQKPEKRPEIARLQLADNKWIRGILFFSSFYPLFPLLHIVGWMGGEGL